MIEETKEELKKEIEELKVTLNGYRDLNSLNLVLIEKLRKENESYKDIFQNLGTQLQEMASKM